MFFDPDIVIIHLLLKKLLNRREAFYLKGIG
jgi:hypothetical protein